MGTSAALSSKLTILIASTLRQYAAGAPARCSQDTSECRR